MSDRARVDQEVDGVGAHRAARASRRHGQRVGVALQIAQADAPAVAVARIEHQLPGLENLRASLPGDRDADAGAVDEVGAVRRCSTLATTSIRLPAPKLGGRIRPHRHGDADDDRRRWADVTTAAAAASGRRQRRVGIAARCPSSRARPPATPGQREPREARVRSLRAHQRRAEELIVEAAAVDVVVLRDVAFVAVLPAHRERAGKQVARSGNRRRHRTGSRTGQIRCPACWWCRRRGRGRSAAATTATRRCRRWPECGSRDRRGTRRPASRPCRRPSRW